VSEARNTTAEYIHKSPWRGRVRVCSNEKRGGCRRYFHFAFILLDRSDSSRSSLQLDHDVPDGDGHKYADANVEPIVDP